MAPKNKPIGIPLSHLIESEARHNSGERDPLWGYSCDLERTLDLMMNYPEGFGPPDLRQAILKNVSKMCKRDATRRNGLKVNAQKGGNAPKNNAAELEDRNAKIVKAHDQGTPTSTLANRFELSPRQINKIIKNHLG